MMTLILLCLSLWLPLIAAQGGGTFRCHACWRAGCTIPDSARLNRINVPNLGSMTCGEVADKAENQEFFPDECSWVQSVTLRSTNPCGCPCDPPTLATPCQMCPPGEIIGDPDFVIRDGQSYVQGFTCGFIFDNPTYISADECPRVAQDVQQQCKCRSLLNEPASRQCVPQENGETPCHPDLTDDRCCDDQTECVHRNSFPGRFVCSAKGNQPWQGAPYSGPPVTPQSSPIASPPSPPTPRPTARPAVVALEFSNDCRQPQNSCSSGKKCIETTSHGWRCVNTESRGCMESARSGSTRGGGAGRRDGC